MVWTKYIFLLPPFCAICQGQDWVCHMELHFRSPWWIPIQLFGMKSQPYDTNNSPKGTSRQFTVTLCSMHSFLLATSLLCHLSRARMDLSHGITLQITLLDPNAGFWHEKSTIWHQQHPQRDIKTIHCRVMQHARGLLWVASMLLWGDIWCLCTSFCVFTLCFHCDSNSRQDSLYQHLPRSFWQLSPTTCVFPCIHVYVDDAPSIFVFCTCSPTQVRYVCWQKTSFYFLLLVV
jgi:hypothetical protein